MPESAARLSRPTIVVRLVAVALLLLSVGCAGSAAWGAGSPRREASTSGDMASLDDVTNGLVNNASRWAMHEEGRGANAGFDDFGPADAANNPLAGAFFNDGDDDDVRARTENYFVSELGREGDPPGADPGVPTGGLTVQGPAPSQRMLVYSGELRVEVARAEDAASSFVAQVEGWGGYLQQQSGTNVLVRLPAARFDEAFTSVRESGRVISEQRRANDVTEEFVDLGIRVDNARRSRDRLLAILEQAEKVEDILAVETQLRRLTEEIERMEGRLKFLRDQVAMATLRADFRSVAEAPPQRRSRRWSRFAWVNRVGPKAVMEGF